MTLEVRKSPIHGRGIFATRRIQPDEMLAVYKGVRTHRNGTYVLWIEDEDGALVGIDGRTQLRFLNHSPVPNAVFYGDELFALSEIEPGTEVTIDYGEDWVVDSGSLAADGRTSVAE